MRLSNVDTRRLSGLKYKLMCHFKLAADMVREFVNDTDRSFPGKGADGIGCG